MALGAFPSTKRYGWTCCRFRSSYPFHAGATLSVPWRPPVAGRLCGATTMHCVPARQAVPRKRFEPAARHGGAAAFTFVQTANKS